MIQPLPPFIDPWLASDAPHFQNTTCQKSFHPFHLGCSRGNLFVRATLLDRHFLTSWHQAHVPCTNAPFRCGGGNVWGMCVNICIDRWRRLAYYLSTLQRATWNLHFCCSVTVFFYFGPTCHLPKTACTSGNDRNTYRIVDDFWKIFYEPTTKVVKPVLSLSTDEIVVKSTDKILRCLKNLWPAKNSTL